MSTTNQQRMEEAIRTIRELCVTDEYSAILVVAQNPGTTTASGERLRATLFCIHEIDSLAGLMRAIHETSGFSAAFTAFANDYIKVSAKIDAIKNKLQHPNPYEPHQSSN